MKVSAMLLHGKDNAITGGKLVEILELKDIRELTQLIERERRAGLLAANAAELGEYINSLDRRLHSVGQTRRHLEATLIRMTGQGKMGGC